MSPSIGACDITINHPAYTASWGNATKSEKYKLAVGNPNSRPPRPAPRTTSPATENSRPNAAFASRTLPSPSKRRISVEQITASSSTNKSMTCTSIPYLWPSSLNTSVVPAAFLPNVKFEPTTTARALSVSRTIWRKNSSGLSCATATLKLIAKIWSIPWAAANDARCVTVPNNGGIRSGRNTANGCGSKVSNMLGRPNSCALVVAAANNRLCPRCMPSKTPMVTTEPVKSFGTSVIPCQISTGLRLRDERQTT